MRPSRLPSCASSTAEATPACATLHRVRTPTTSLAAAAIVAAAAGCRDSPPTPPQIADRGWQAHELVIAAGEQAASCAEAGLAMQRVFIDHRQAFVDAIALDNDPARLAEAAAFITANDRRYTDLALRMEALAERCSDDATVTATFHMMESP
jgi:hypothetical protein